MDVDGPADATPVKGIALCISRTSKLGVGRNLTSIPSSSKTRIRSKGSADQSADQANWLSEESLRRQIESKFSGIS